jgi:transposase InsO family protein
VKTNLHISQLLGWIGLQSSKFYNWKKRYGKVNEHNTQVPRDHWLEDWEKEAIVAFHGDHSQDGYRRLTYQMMDQEIVAASPTTVYRVLKDAGCLERWNAANRSKKSGFDQPELVHEHWHIDICYINVCGTFYYLINILDGASRYLIHCELREQMTEADVEITLQRAKEKFPEARPRIISDNGPQFIAKDFKEYIRISGMTHVRTRPYHPQSNGKVERYHKTLKQECIRPQVALSMDEAAKQIERFVDDYNHKRLHSSIGYVTPADKLSGREQTIFADRDRKLALAREQRAKNRQSARKKIRKENQAA